MTEALDRLRKVLALERQRKFADTVVIGGLDSFLLRFVQDEGIPHSHAFSRVLQSLPPGGYHALHQIQRRTVVNALLDAVKDGLPAAGRPASPPPAPPRPAPPAAPPPPPKRKPPKVSPKRPAAAGPMAGTLDSPVTVLAGVGRGMASRLASANVGVSTVRDLLYLGPSRYEQRLGARPIARLVPDMVQTIVGEVWASGSSVLGRRKVGETLVSDPTGSVRIIWWSGPWMAKQLREGMRVAFTGKVTAYRGRLQMENPDRESPDDESIRASRVLPVYPGTKGLESRDVRPLIQAAVDAFADKLVDVLPEEMRRRLGLMTIVEAVRRRHSPASQEEGEEARRRLAFDELLAIELGVVRRRKEWQSQGGARRLSLPPSVREGFVRSLPFDLTGDQAKAIAEVLADTGRDVPMNRLLEGDVGTGKTAVAAAALLAAVASGYQGAIMAPTEILAEQLYRTVCKLLDPRFRTPGDGASLLSEAAPGLAVLHPPCLDREVRIGLLRGSQKASAKRMAQEAIETGEIDIAAGTHALIQQAVGFDRLALAVVDEQHRFGVEQRAALREKGGAPHVLAMTATPIPRTLALTVYGDLDITVLEETPDDRPTVKTFRANSRRAAEAYEFMRRKIHEGKQAYVICPLVEESEAIEAKAAVQEYERLHRDVFPEFRLGLLHGRMSAPEKDATMRAFRDRELDILVSTSVVEVGIDVPNATVMLIEGADRFGLSQLHQFRGRVRRSTEQAYCFLLSDNVSEEAQQRLGYLETKPDGSQLNGFQLAEKDLELRGAGEYFGTRQSGLPDLRAARLTDVGLIDLARKEATRLLDEDPALARPEHAALKAEVEKIWARLTAEAS